MDDIFVAGSSAKDMHKAVKLLIKNAKDLGLTIKENWFV